MHRRITLTGLAGAATAVVGLGLPIHGAWAAPLAPANGTSTSMAGYQVKTPPASASATDTFTVPKLTCSTTTSGVAAVALIPVMVAGKVSASAAFVLIECVSGAPTYVGGEYVNGTSTPAGFTPKAGDVMVATVSESATSTKVTLKDVTQSKSKSVSKTAGGSPLAVFDGITGLPTATVPPGQLPVPNFGKVSFTAAKEDGVTPAAAHAVALDMKTSGGVLQIQTGALNATGNGWTETFKHS